MAQVIAKDEIDFAAYLRETDAKQKIRPASDYMGEVIDHTFGEKADPKCFLPWQKTHKLIQFRPGEVTLWAGINGHGKSLMTGQVSLSLMGQSEPVCVASFEMKPRKTLTRMARQWAALPANSEHDTPEMRETSIGIYRQFSDWTNKKLWIYDHVGAVRSDVILGAVKYCAVELGIKHMFIDSLMKCVKGEDDYNAQKDFVDNLCALAQETGIHIHLVHHIKKLADEERIPGKFDAKGSGSISDQVDNFLVVYRNKRKERERDEGKAVAADDPDALIICHKQRESGWEGRIGLFVDPESQQFKEHPYDRPVCFDEWPHRPWS